MQQQLQVQIAQADNLIQQIDAQGQRMIAELEKRGKLDNTLIIVTSDNGMPFPRCKGYAYEDSNHIPLAVRWPVGLKKPGRVIDDFVNFTDIAPTILDYTGIDEKDSGIVGWDEARRRRIRFPFQIGFVLTFCDSG